MKNRKNAIICHSLAMMCWGILVYAGIYYGKAINVTLYGLCFVCSMILLILNIASIKKEKHYDPDKN